MSQPLHKRVANEIKELVLQLEELKEENSKLKTQNTVILSGLEWQGDGYVWNGPLLDYRIDPETAVQVIETKLQRLEEYEIQEVRPYLLDAACRAVDQDTFNSFMADYTRIKTRKDKLEKLLLATRECLAKLAKVCVPLASWMSAAVAEKNGCDEFLEDAEAFSNEVSGLIAAGTIADPKKESKYEEESKCIIDPDTATPKETNNEPF